MYILHVFCLVLLSFLTTFFSVSTVCLASQLFLLLVAYPILGEVVVPGSARCRALSDACALAAVCVFIHVSAVLMYL